MTEVELIFYPMEAKKYNELLSLSSDDKLELVELLWENISSDPNNIPLTKEQSDELDKRLERHNSNNSEGKSWEEVRKTIERL